MESLRYWVGFSLIDGIGPVKFKRLLDHFGDMQIAWEASKTELLHAGLDAKASEAVVTRRGHINLDREMEKIQRLQVKVITLSDTDYPELLRHLYAPPPLLYVKGTILPEDQWAVAVVGTRRSTMYGREATERIVSDMARSQVTIVSGLAKGVDSHAHRTALETGGRTIAVLGSGVDVIYPSENANLARAIVEHGAVISEYPLGTKPEAVNFPPRNRIISGLSLGTVVIEAGETSGALITADFALEQGRDVFAVPGGIFWPKSVGTNRLISQGAKLVGSAQDILEELNLSMVGEQLEMRELLPENETEAAIMRLVSSVPCHIDELGRNSGLPISAISSTLAMMELKGMVRQVGGMNYVLAR